MNPGLPPGATMGFSTMSGAGAEPAETIRNPEPELVALLLKAGADPNSADRAGRTPLMFAAAQGRLELAQALLAGGADVEAKAANGKTAWHVAMGRRSCGCCGRPGGSADRCSGGIQVYAGWAESRIDPP